MGAVHNRMPPQMALLAIEVIKLDSPNGGATYTSGELRSIVWTTNAIKGDVG